MLKRPTRGASTLVGDIHDAMLWVGARRIAGLAGSMTARSFERIAKVVLAFVAL